MNKDHQDKCKYCQALALTEFDLPEEDGGEIKIAGEWLDCREIEYIWAMGYCPDQA